MLGFGASSAFCETLGREAEPGLLLCALSQALDDFRKLLPSALEVSLLDRERALVGCSVVARLEVDACGRERLHDDRGLLLALDGSFHHGI